MAGGDQLSSALRRLRQGTGLSGPEVAERTRTGGPTRISQSRLSRVETGRYAPRPGEVAALCALYRASPEETTRLVGMAEDLTTRVAPARVVLQRGDSWRLQHRIARIESAAAEIAVFQPALVPGLLQTESYMRAVFSDGGAMTPKDLERSVQARLARAKVLDSDRSFTFIIPEGAIRWCAVNGRVMSEQLRHLADLAPKVRIGVISSRQPMSTFVTNGFSVYDRRTVMVGTRTGTSIITANPDLEDYLSQLAELERSAIYGQGAEDLLVAIAAEYETLVDHENGEEP